MKLILIIAALVFFILAGFNVTHPRLNFMCLGFACLTATLLPI